MDYSKIERDLESTLYKVRKLKKSSQNAKGYGFFLLIGIIIVVIMILYRLLFNFINIPTIFNYSFKQYINNISGFHMDTYYKCRKNYNIYKTYGSSYSERNNLQIIGYLKRGSNFKLKGCIINKNSTYLAIFYYSNSKSMRGYICLPVKKRYNKIFEDKKDASDKFLKKIKKGDIPKEKFLNQKI